MNRTIAVGPAGSIAPGEAKCVTVNGAPIAIFNVNGALYALDDTCSHAKASLSQGEVYADELCVECPLHGASFDLRTGQPLTLPAIEPVRRHAVAVVDGVIRVTVSA